MATTAATKKKEPGAIGRPKSKFEGRTYLRRHDEQEERWQNAADTSGLDLPEWMRQTLDAEAKNPTHVQMIKRIK